MIDLSVILVNWNTGGYLLRCLGSLSRSGGQATREVIVVDNASEDGSVEKVRNHYPAVQLVINAVNLGFAKATNQGLSRASGRYLLLLNPDTEVNPGALEGLLAFMESRPDAGIAGPQLLNGDGSRQNSIANYPTLTTELLNKRLLRWLFPARYPGKESDYTGPIEVDSVIGACLMVRREALKQVGLLDEAYFLFLEETDWCYRMKKEGWRVYHVPGVEVVHYQGKGAETKKKEAKVEYYRSRYQFFRKNRGLTQEKVLLAGLLVRLSMEVLTTGAGCLLTLFANGRWRKRFLIYLHLLFWHLRLCPEGMGLKPTCDTMNKKR